MDIVDNFDFVKQKITEIKSYKKRVESNFFLDEKRVYKLIGQKRFYFVRFEQVVFFLKSVIISC